MRVGKSVRALFPLSLRRPEDPSTVIAKRSSRAVRRREAAIPLQTREAWRSTIESRIEASLDGYRRLDEWSSFWLWHGQYARLGHLEQERDTFLTPLWVTLCQMQESHELARVPMPYRQQFAPQDTRSYRDAETIKNYLKQWIGWAPEHQERRFEELQQALQGLLIPPVVPLGSAARTDWAAVNELLGQALDELYSADDRRKLVQLVEAYGGEANGLEREFLDDVIDGGRVRKAIEKLSRPNPYVPHFNLNPVHDWEKGLPHYERGSEDDLNVRRWRGWIIERAKEAFNHYIEARAARGESPYFPEDLMGLAWIVSHDLRDTTPKRREEILEIGRAALRHVRSQGELVPGYGPAVAALEQAIALAEAMAPASAEAPSDTVPVRPTVKSEVVVWSELPTSRDDNLYNHFGVEATQAVEKGDSWRLVQTLIAAGEQIHDHNLRKTLDHVVREAFRARGCAPVPAMDLYIQDLWDGGGTRALIEARDLTLDEVARRANQVYALATTGRRDDLVRYLQQRSRQAQSPARSPEPGLAAIRQLIARHLALSGASGLTVPHELPDEATLGKYMYLLRQVLTQARARAEKADPQMAELLGAVENVPDLLLRWNDIDASLVTGDLHRVEGSHPEWRGCFTTPLEEGTPGDNQPARDPSE